MRRRNAICCPLLLAVVVTLMTACDRNVEPFVSGERPARPDLSKIFPPGAERTKESAAPGEGGLPPVPPGQAMSPSPADGEEAAPAEVAAPIRGRVLIADALVSRATPGATLFVIARGAADGPPLAVRRITAPAFPLEFEIGPNDRMIASVPFTGPLQLSARLDGDGNATTREPGDLRGTAKAAAQPGDTNVSIVLDEAS